MTDREMLRDALAHEEEAVRLYRRYAQQCEDQRVQEMFEQFAMNESWHGTAIRQKLKDMEN